MFFPRLSLRRFATKSVLPMLTGLILSVSGASAQTTSPGLRTSYFSGTNLSGAPLAQVVVGNVNSNWGLGKPHAAVPADGWSVRYEGLLTAPITGEVLLETLSDDGVRFWVGGAQLVNNWTRHGATSDVARVSMTKGQKLAIVGEFYEASGLALAKIRWSYPGRTLTAIPASAFSFSPKVAPKIAPAVMPTPQPVVVPTPLPTPVPTAVPPPLPTPQDAAIYVSPQGNPGGDGTLSDPVSTVARAIQLAPENGEIVLRGGNYPISAPIWVAKAGLTIRNFEGETPILSASNAETSTAPHVLVIVKSNVTLSGLDIRGGCYYGVKIDVDDAGTPTRGVVVRGCRISNTGRDCIKTFNADELLIEGCDIGPSGLRDASNAEGIDSIGSKGVTIRGNFVHDTATTGIYLKGGAIDGLIEGNRVENTRAHGILLGQDTDLEFMREGVPFEARRCIARRNHVSNTLASGIGTYSGEEILFEGNTLVHVARDSNAGLMVGINRRGVGARDVRFNGNTLQMSGARPFAFLLDMAGAFSAQNNRYLWTGSPNTFRIQRSSALQDLGFEAWRAAMQTDAGSTFASASGAS